ncbi:hypothetical protein [Neobacillus ginsengisoli]|uniref:DNA-binding protein n=1 Tax=Neobacillus ginsengisoli TaxID=904295 RepID=A0ABT9XVH8_9BACI|nr:hypothetical protein [Neobacillus ginsengisoli]MDQ0199563.1 hypothetical protein [Neobacillus ginsengisoli]
MSLKSALFEMRDELVSSGAVRLDENYFHELEAKNHLSAGTLVYYFNNLMLLGINNSDHENQTSDDSKKVNRKWSKNEIDFMFQYIKERQDEGALNITEILNEIAQLLNRGYQSVNYKYYTLVKSKEKKQQANQNEFIFTTIKEAEIPVISVEPISETTQAPQLNPSNSAQNDDLLDILSGLITNVQQLPGINLNELLKSLYQLTNLALQNQDAVQQLESIKTETNLEKEVLQEKLRKKDQQLMQEKKRNDELQLEIAKIVNEISAFNQLGDAAKIQNLKKHNQRLNYIIDGSGLVLQVGS